MTKLDKIALSTWIDRMQKKPDLPIYHFFECDTDKVLDAFGKEKSLQALREMMVIRNFEMRGAQAYQMGKVWGFYHEYTGQEAIQTAAVYALGKKKHLWVGSYRCHALALLLGMTPKEGMCELYGKKNGNALGRGGSMHFYAENMFGGNGIVGGQWPIGAGLAFSLKYRNIKDQVAVCFGGDGACMIGTFAESMNLASLWNLPLIVVIENNQYAMGTALHRGVANLPLGENVAKAYGIKSYTVDGQHFGKCLALFREAYEYVTEKQRPVIIEAVSHRFKGHSISDAGQYRTKEEVAENMKFDPIQLLIAEMEKRNWISVERAEELNKSCKEEILEAMKFADESPFPDVNTLETGVFKGEEI